MTRYGFPEVSVVITKKGVYVYENTWEKVLKVVAPGIRKTKVRNIDCVLPIYYLHI